MVWVSAVALMRQQFGRCCGKDNQPSSSSTGILMVVRTIRLVGSSVRAHHELNAGASPCAMLQVLCLMRSVPAPAPAPAPAGWCDAR